MENGEWRIENGELRIENYYTNTDITLKKQKNNNKYFVRMAPCLALKLRVSESNEVYFSCRA